MCMSAPSFPEQKEPEIPVAPPPPPPPAPTAQGLTIGKDRRSTPLQTLFATALGKRAKNPLRIDLGGTDAAAGSGLNIPQ